MKHAGRLGLDTKRLMKQSEEMLDSGYDIDYVGNWLNAIIQAAGNATAAAQTATQNNGGIPPTPAQLAGKAPSYSDNNMPPGTFLQIKPQLHPSMLVEMIITSMASLMEICKRDPKKVNPYNFRWVSLNRYLDETAERQFWSGNIPEQIETGEFEEIGEIENPKTKKKEKRKVPILKKNPHFSLLEKKLKAEAAGLYEKWDPVTQIFPEWMNMQKGYEWTPTNEELDTFTEGVKMIRHNLQSTLFMHNLFRYVDINQVNVIHNVDQLPELAEDQEDLTPELKQDRAREYENNLIVMTRKGVAFLQMYFYGWPQPDQKGIYQNYIMMGLDKNVTW